MVTVRPATVAATDIFPFEAGFAGVRGNPFSRVLNDVRQGLGQKPPVKRHLDRILRKPLLKHNGRMCDPHQEKDLAHTFAKIAAFETGFRHPRERRKFIHHAFDVVDLPDDCIGTLVENVAVLLDQTAIFAFQPFGGQLDRSQRIFDFMGDPAGDIGPRRCPLRGHEIGDIVERHDIALVGAFARLAGDANVEKTIEAPSGK